MGASSPRSFEKYPDSSYYARSFSRPYVSDTSDAGWGVNDEGDYQSTRLSAMGREFTNWRNTPPAPVSWWPQKKERIADAWETFYFYVLPVLSGLFLFGVYVYAEATRYQGM